MKASRTDDGAVTAELVVAMPLLMVLLLGVVQFALWQHAGHVAQAAARAGATAARLEGGTEDAGRSRAEHVLDVVAGGVLDSTAVRVVRDQDRAWVEVTGRAESVVPGLHLPVRATAEGRVERFRPPGEAP
jgi:Flp pilus assembly protein TadG